MLAETDKSSFLPLLDVQAIIICNDSKRSEGKERNPIHVVGPSGNASSGQMSFVKVEHLRIRRGAIEV
jgi:hypothetical protein